MRVRINIKREGNEMGKFTDELDTFASNALKHWRTTVIGVMVGIAVGYQVWTDPSALNDTGKIIEKCTAAFGAIALVGTKDWGDKK